MDDDASSQSAVAEDISVLKRPRLTRIDSAEIALIGAEAEITSTIEPTGQEQDDLGEVIKGAIVVVHSVDPTGVCSVETRDGRRGKVDGHYLRLHLMLNLALESEAAALVRGAIEQVAHNITRNTVSDALREGRTYPHLTLKYDFVADGSQLAQLLAVLQKFAASHMSVPLRLTRASVFGSDVAFLDVEPQPAVEGSQSRELLEALRRDLASLKWLPCDTKMPHWHATVAMGWPHTDADICDRVRTWLEEHVQMPCDFEFSNVAVMCKAPERDTGAYMADARRIISFALQPSR